MAVSAQRAVSVQRWNPLPPLPAGGEPGRVCPRREAFLRTLRRLGAVRREWMTRALMQSLFRGIDFRGRRVLDIGGGDGVYSFYAAAMGAREVVCLEPEAAGSIGGEARMFERIRGEMPDLPVRLVQQTVDDYEDDEGFDVVAMIASINHLDEDACMRLGDDAAAQAKYRAAFRHIASFTRRGGRLVVADCTRHNFFAALGLVNPLCPTIEWDKHQPPQVWARLLEDAGFRHARTSWEPLYSFGPVGQALLSNAFAAWLLKSCFRLEMTRR
jgi:SAM-dependent methyltransferase